MSARDRAREAWEAAQEALEASRERRRGRRSARKGRRSAGKEKRQVRRAVRRSKIWGAADVWWSLRQDIANDPKAKKRIRRLATTINPMAGLIAAAAMEVDRVVAPTALNFIEEKQAVTRAILQEMVDAGRITEAEAGILAVQADEVLAGTAYPVPRGPSAPRAGPTTASPAAMPTALPANYWPWIIAVGAFFLIRGAK